MVDSAAPRRHALDHWLVWAALALLAAFGLAQVSILRGEHVNALWMVVAVGSAVARITEIVRS